jgi:hypothetical protein
VLRIVIYFKNTPLQIEINIVSNWYAYRKTLDMKKMLLYLIFIQFIFTELCLAAATFGAEFNFTNAEILADTNDVFAVNSPSSESARDTFLKKTLENCKNCSFEKIYNSYGVLNYKILYPDGWYFVIATDPGVVEVQTKPSTEKQIEKNLKRIQADIFDTAFKSDLFPASRFLGQKWAGSHIHVGAISAFGKNESSVRLLKNFMVDFTNHPELALGIFTEDLVNAPPLHKLPREQQENFKKIIHDVESGKINSIHDFAKKIRKTVYNVTIHNLAPTTKYQAFNINRIDPAYFKDNEQTFELRAMRGQDSALDFLIEVKLINSRLNYLKNKNEIVQLQRPLFFMSDFEKTEAFFNYVTETGLDFEPYEKFLSTSQKSYLQKIKQYYLKKSCQFLFAN